MPMNPELQARLDSINAPHRADEPRQKMDLLPPIDFSSLRSGSMSDGMSITEFMDERLKNGFEAGELYLIPSRGATDIPKSNLTLDLALKVAREQNVPLVFLDLESNPAIDEARFRTAFAKLDARKVETKLVVTEERPEVDDFADTIPGDWE